MSRRCELLTWALMVGVMATVASRPAAAQAYPNGLYAEVATSKGLIVLSLDLRRTPMTVANFVGLAEGTVENDAFSLGRPFFDGTRFHRVEHISLPCKGRVNPALQADFACAALPCFQRQFSNVLRAFQVRCITGRRVLPTLGKSTEITAVGADIGGFG